MKKILSCVMALSIAACTVLSASAAPATTVSEPGENEVNVKISNGDAKYTVEIPGDVTIEDKEGSTTVGNLVANATLLNHGDELTVSVASKNEFNLNCASPSDTHKISYELKSAGTKVNQNDELITCASGANDTKELTIDSLDISNAKCAGEYSDVLTFTVAVGAA